MKRVFVLLIGAVLLTAACSSDSKTSSSSSSTSSSSSSTPASSASSSSASSPSGGAATLAVATNAKVGKSILVDSKGMTVYLYMPDGSNTTSQVTGGLKQAWPAVTATESTAGTGVDASKLSLQPQPDGTKQVAYNGHLLYTYIGDKAAGDANGQGLGGIWYVLTADGEKVDSD